MKTMTYEEIHNILTETAESIREITESRKKRELELIESKKTRELEFTEFKKKRELEFAEFKKAHDLELVKLQKEHELRLEVLRKNGEQRKREIELSFKRVNEQLGGIGQTQGDIAEDMFRRSVPTLLAKRGLNIKRIETQLRAGSEAEFDLVAINGDCVVVVEVKNKLHARHLRKFANKQLPRFKHLFTEFAHHTIYGGVAAMVVKDEVEQQAESLGLFVFTQSSDGNAEIANPEDFHARTF